MLNTATAMYLDSVRQDRPFPQWLLLLLAMALAGNVLAWFGIGLLPDEAYYWVWSQRLELSYFDHPPLVAWLMRPFTALLGNDATVIRLPAVLSWLVGAVLAYDLTRRAFGHKRAGALAVLIWTTLPIMQIGFHIVTPDNPLIIFTWFTYYFAFRAQDEQRPGFWLLTGLNAGLALLAKYPAVLVMGSVFIALLLTRQGRRELATPWPWLGAVLALLVFMPVVLWNLQHDWISFAFQLGHGIQRDATPQPGAMFVLFLGGQLAVTMPWTFFAMAWSSIGGGGRYRRLGSGGRALLASGFWLPLVVFGIAGLTANSGPNWPETAYVPGTVLLAGALHGWLYPPARARGRARPWLLAIVILAAFSSVLLINLLRFPHWLEAVGGAGLSPKRTQLSQSYGWEQVGGELRRLLPQVEDTHPAGAACRIIVDNHTSAAMVAWLLNAPQRVGVTLQTRVSQYHLWQHAESWPAADICLYMDKFDSEDESEEQIPQRTTLPEGDWRRISLLEVRNPDLSVRWYAFFVPEAPAATTPLP